jgi:thiol-disulfide isomerase/thioredoxin
LCGPPFRISRKKYSLVYGLKKTFFLLLILLYAVALVACSRNDQVSRAGQQPEVGEIAPDFTLKDLRGRNVSLSEYRGHVVILDFWATWCGPCRTELPNVVKMWDDLKGKGLVLVGISLDFDDKDAKATDKVAKFAPENGMTWTHIVEGKYWDSEIGRLYQVSGIPQTVLIDREGKISALGLRGEKLHEAAKKALEEG